MIRRSSVLQENGWRFLILISPSLTPEVRLAIQRPPGTSDQAYCAHRKGHRDRPACSPRNSLPRFPRFPGEAQRSCCRCPPWKRPETTGGWQEKLRRSAEKLRANLHRGCPRSCTSPGILAETASAEPG